MKGLATPGPWTHERMDPNDLTIAVRGDDRLVATVHTSGLYEETWGDARLIAAAPEMLAALEALCGVYEGYEDVPQYVLKARAALRKAKETVLHRFDFEAE